MDDDGLGCLVMVGLVIVAVGICIAAAWYEFDRGVIAATRGTYEAVLVEDDDGSTKWMVRKVKEQRDASK